VRRRRCASRATSRRQWRPAPVPRRARRGEEEREWGEGRVVGSVAALRTTRPDRWARGRRTGATARPRGGHGLRPVGQFTPFDLNCNICNSVLQHCNTGNPKTAAAFKPYSSQTSLNHEVSKLTKLYLIKFSTTYSI
jgi:hypothetical protein